MKALFGLGLILLLSPFLMADEITDHCGSHPSLIRDAKGGAVWHSPEQMHGLVVSKVQPEKPAIGGFNYDGVVSFKLMVNTTGNVICMWDAAGHPLMIPGAAKAVREWKFKPQQRAGVPAEYVGTLKVPVSTKQ